MVFLQELLILSLCAVVVIGLKEGDSVAVSMNKVWPFHNPFETYSYYDALPVCQPTELEFGPMSFGQIMRGDRLVNSLYNIQYLSKLFFIISISREYNRYQISVYLASLRNFERSSCLRENPKC